MQLARSRPRKVVRTLFKFVHESITAHACTFLCLQRRCSASGFYVSSCVSSTTHALWYSRERASSHIRTQIRQSETTLLQYIMCHSPVRKLYSTVSKSTTIPGRKIRFLMFIWHSRSVCTVYVIALMTYRVCSNRVRRVMQIHMLACR